MVMGVMKEYMPQPASMRVDGVTSTKTDANLPTLFFVCYHHFLFVYHPLDCRSATKLIIYSIWRILIIVVQRISILLMKITSVQIKS